MFVYKVLTSSELVCTSYDHIYVSIDVLPEAICCCLQTCNFVVMFMLFVCKVLTTSELVCVGYDHTFVPIIIYCLRAFVVVYKHVILL